MSSLTFNQKSFLLFISYFVLQLSHGEQKSSSLESDLKIEREWRLSLQEALDADRSQRELQIRTQQELDKLKKVKKNIIS